MVVRSFVHVKSRFRRFVVRLLAPPRSSSLSLPNLSPPLLLPKSSRFISRHFPLLFGTLGSVVVVEPFAIAVLVAGTELRDEGGFVEGELVESNRSSSGFAGGTSDLDNLLLVAVAADEAVVVVDKIDRSKVEIEMEEEQIEFEFESEFEEEVEKIEFVSFPEVPAFHVLQLPPVSRPFVLPHLLPFQVRRTSSYR